MYCEYYYKSSASVIEVLNDIKNVLTGETYVSNLSNSCRKDYTYLSTESSPSGWNLVDDRINVDNSFVISSPISDDPSKEKVVRIQITPPYLYLMLYESWDTSTGSGSNIAYLSDSADYAQPVDLDNGGIIAITASPNHVGILGITFVSSGVGSSIGSAPVFVAEITRESEWDTPLTNPSIPVIWFNASLVDAYAPSVSIPTNSGFSTYYSSSAKFSIYGGISQLSLIDVSNYLYNHSQGRPVIINPYSSTEKHYLTVPIYAACSATSYSQVIHKGGYVSPKADVWVFSANFGPLLGRLKLTYDTYVIWTFGSGGRLLVNGG